MVLLGVSEYCGWTLEGRPESMPQCPICTVKRMWNAEISFPSTRSGAEAPSWHPREFFSAVLSRHKLSEVGASNLQRTAKP